MSRTSRQDFLHLLRSGARITKREAADRLDVTPRTINRAVDDLEKQGIRIRTERREHGRKVYFLDEEDRWPLDNSLGVTEGEALALIIAIEAARPALRATPMEETLTALLDTLISEIGGGVMTFEPDTVRQRFHFSNAPSVQVDPDVFTTVRRAILNQERLRMDYFTASRNDQTCGREIDPAGLAFVKGSWMCMGYCRREHKEKDFNLVGMSNVEPTGTHFDARTLDADAFWSLEGTPQHTVRIRPAPAFADKVVPYFRRKNYHPSQVITETDDGSVEIVFQVEALWTIEPFLRSWGPKIEVLSPPTLRDTLQADAQRTAALYTDGA